MNELTSILVILDRGSEVRPISFVSPVQGKEIVSRAQKYPDIVRELAPALAPPDKVGLDIETHQIFDTRHAELIQRFDAFQTQTSAPVDGLTHAQLNQCRDLLEANDYKAVRPLLEKIRAREWAGANNAVRFRIATNLAAMYWGLGEARAAGEHFLEAFEFDRAAPRGCEAG